MFSPRKKSGKKKDEKQERKGKAHMFNQRSSVLCSKRSGEAKPWAAVGTWFLGPKAENADVFEKLMNKAVHSHFKFREGFYPCDPPYVTDELREAPSFKISMDRMEKELDKMQRDLHKSVPFFSTRYKGHVNWDTAVPANLGYIASILWNQNNCAGEGGPKTTEYEVEAGSDLCEMIGFNRDESMGHLVTGGSIANIEALWVARNLKYYPLGLQEALIKDDRLKAAKGYEICLPQRGGHQIPLVYATSWELLNLDTDAIVRMPFDVAKLAGLEERQEEFREIMGGYLYESIGAQEFCLRHKLTNSPCVVVGKTYHVSFMKAMTILGLGKESLATVPVDKDARLDSAILALTLQHKRLNQIPVISVIGIMGTTEESAVDPLDKILEIRKNLRIQGLNFSIHADAAWGAYFCCMLRDPPLGDIMPSANEEGFVPELSLNNYVTKQLKVLKECDTVTCDPHKSGFCPYPAGAICYRDKNLNNFLNLTSGVLYYHGSVNLGDYGIEGSKPGAAASGVLLANKVIGLHKNGYGRILAECMFTSKILYCYWACLAEDDDNFVVATNKALPSEDAKAFIRKNILGKSNEEIAENQEIMKFLQEIGPDTLVPCFSVNIRGNTDVNVTNDTVAAIFNDLCHGESEQRTPMIVTSSTMTDHRFSHSLEDFKGRLGLDKRNKDGVKYVITTCLDPWSSSMEFVDDLAYIMRNAILNAIGTITDKPAYHSFVSVDKVNEKKQIVVCYAGNFKQPQLQYFVVARFKFLSDEAMDTFAKKSDSEKEPIVLRSCEKKGLHDIVFDDSDEEKRPKETFDFFVGFPTESSVPFMKADLKTIDVPRYDHFDKADDQYPDNATYLMYGDVGNAYLFHLPTKDPDYLQIVSLAEVPANGLGDGKEKEKILKHGVDAELLGVPGSPTEEGGKIVDPLKNSEYKLNFVGIKGEEFTVPVVVKRKIWFDGEMLNKS